MAEKLSNDKIKEIKQLSSQGKSGREIAKLLGVHNTTVDKYINGITKETTKDVEKIFTSDEKKKLNMIQQYTPQQLEEILYRLNINEKNNIDEVIGEKWYLKFWLISDTHYWNKMCAKDEIWEFMDKVKDEWAECFIHCWDFVDGDNVYTGQIYELENLWFDEQLKEVVKDYPNLWIPTYAISWNHDESFLKKSWWDILKAISMVRKDIINLGFYDARIKLNGVDINAHHWWGNMSYARSYKPQKLMENINPKDQPHIFASWHWHTALYMFYRKIHWFLPWAFLKENLLAKRFNLDNTIGGWVIEVEIDEKGWTKIWMNFIKV